MLSYGALGTIKLTIYQFVFLLSKSRPLPPHMLFFFLEALQETAKAFLFSRDHPSAVLLKMTYCLWKGNAERFKALHFSKGHFCLIVDESAFILSREACFILDCLYYSKPGLVIHH